MSSSEDLFLDNSLSQNNATSSPMDQSPSPPLVPLGDSTPGSPSPTQPTCYLVSPSPPSPTPPFAQDSENFDIIDLGPVDVTEGGKDHPPVKQIKVEFLDSNGEQVCQSRFCTDSDLIDILGNLVRAGEQKYKKLTVSKFCRSVKFKHLIEEQVLYGFSKHFSDFISSDICPLKNKELLANLKDLSEVSFDRIFNQCITDERDLLNAICVLCFGVGLESLESKEVSKAKIDVSHGNCCIFS